MRYSLEQSDITSDELYDISFLFEGDDDLEHNTYLNEDEEVREIDHVVNYPDGSELEEIEEPEEEFLPYE